MTLWELEAVHKCDYTVTLGVRNLEQKVIKPCKIKSKFTSRKKKNLQHFSITFLIYFINVFVSAYQNPKTFSFNYIMPFVRLMLLVFGSRDLLSLNYTRYYASS